MQSTNKSSIHVHIEFNTHVIITFQHASQFHQEGRN